MSIEKIYTANSTNFHVVSELAFLVSDILNRVQNGYLSIKSQSSKKNKSIDAESLHDFKDKQRRKRLKNEDIVSALDTCVSISSLINNNNIPASTAKAIMKKLYQSNFSGRKTVIITGIDKMRAEGANAFLKTLEEPPGDTRIILITSKPDDVLPTIKSRCNIFHLKSLNSEEKRLIIKENWDIDVSDNIFDGSLLKIAASLKENAAEDIYNSLINGITLNLGEAASKLSQSDNLEEHIRSLLDLTNKKLKNQPDQLIELSRQADRAIFYINKNNADKLMTVESLLLSFYGAWRKALT
jgi:DNA polymerase III delta prime subunit